MKQYLDALKNREEVAQEIIVELKDRFKEPVEEPVEVVPVPTLEERVAEQEQIINELVDMLAELLGV